MDHLSASPARSVASPAADEWDLLADYELDDLLEGSGGPGAEPPPDPGVEGVRGFLLRLTEMTGTGTTDADRIDQLRALEEAKAAIAAAQARVTLAFEASQLAAQEAAGVPARRRGRGIGDQVALARRTPTNQGGRHVGFAHAMAEMPHTHALLSAGQISEWTATVLARETACLAREDRAVVDRRLCALTFDPATGELSGPLLLDWSLRRIESEVRALAYQLDPEAVVARRARAERDRRVSIRPAPDTMALVTGLLPVARGVACWASLDAAARALKAAGDDRSLDQLRADLFVERLTGQTRASAVPVEIGIIATHQTVTGHGDGAGRPGRTTQGGGAPLPADLVRELIDAAPLVHQRPVTVDPDTGEVTGVGRRRRFHRGGAARTIRTRDQRCRFPGCHGPIAHLDHPAPVAAGGDTSQANSQGLCEAHNYVKETPGWRTEVTDERPGHHTVETTTPTGHTYRSRAPAALPLRL